VPAQAFYQPSLLRAPAQQPKVVHVHVGDHWTVALAFSAAGSSATTDVTTKPPRSGLVQLDERIERATKKPPPMIVLSVQQPSFERAILLLASRLRPAPVSPGPGGGRRPR
jgi:hypothetical protein